MVKPAFLELGYELIGTRSKDVDGEIERLCSRIGASLPRPYLRMLQTFGTAIRFKKDVCFTPIEDSV